jgi:hypothetical protein
MVPSTHRPWPCASAMDSFFTCIVEEYDATSVIRPDARAHLDDYGNIVIEVAP